LVVTRRTATEHASQDVHARFVPGSDLVTIQGKFWDLAGKPRGDVNGSIFSPVGDLHDGDWRQQRVELRVGKPSSSSARAVSCSPEIPVVAGELPRAVDQAEEALIASGRELYPARAPSNATIQLPVALCPT
jgi:hypothetical protein